MISGSTSVRFKENGALQVKLAARGLLLILVTPDSGPNLLWVKYEWDVNCYNIIPWITTIPWISKYTVGEYWGSLPSRYEPIQRIVVSLYSGQAGTIRRSMLEPSSRLFVEVVMFGGLKSCNRVPLKLQLIMALGNWHLKIANVISGTVLFEGSLVKTACACTIIM